MATRNQLDKVAYDMYGLEYDELLPGEKAAVTRAANKKYKKRQTKRKASGTSGKVYFTRFGMDRIKEVELSPGDTLRTAYERQKGTSGAVVIDEDKEGFVDKDTGRTINWDNTLEDGMTLVATVGISSA